MSIRARVLGLLVLLLAAAVDRPAHRRGRHGPRPGTGDRRARRPCVGPLSANTEITDVARSPRPGSTCWRTTASALATVERPLTITSVGAGRPTATVTTDGTTVTYDPRGLRDRRRRRHDSFSYTITDGATIEDAGLAVVPSSGPPTSPVTDAPQVGLRRATPPSAPRVPLKVTWCGVTASGSSVKGVPPRAEHQRRHRPSRPCSAAPRRRRRRRATRRSARATPGASRTTDTLNRVGGFAASLPSRVTVIQDSSASVTYSTGWSSAAGSKYSGGRERYTSEGGRDGDDHRHATCARWRSSHRRARAAAASTSTSTACRVTSSAISQRTGTAAWRRVLYIRGLTSGAGVTHKVQFRAVGNGRVDLDAFLTLSGKQDQAVTFSTTAPTDAAYRGTDYAVAATSSSGLPVTLSVNPVVVGGVLARPRASSASTGTAPAGSTRPRRATRPGTRASPSQTFTVAKRTHHGHRHHRRRTATYDGTAAATLDVSGAAFGPGDVLAGDIVTLVTTGATGTFTPDGSAGAGKTVQVAGLTLTGADCRQLRRHPAHDDRLDRDRRTSRVSFIAADRTYDGTTAAAITSCSVATVLAGDVVTCDDSGATASFANANAGTRQDRHGLRVRPRRGRRRANYVIDTVDTTTADIAKATQTVAFTSSAPVGANVGNTYTPTATATSGLSVTITVDPGSAAVCHIAARRRDGGRRRDVHPLRRPGRGREPPGGPPGPAELRGRVRPARPDDLVRPVGRRPRRTAGRPSAISATATSGLTGRLRVADVAGVHRRRRQRARS